MGKRLQGELTVPGDKSISHRSVMFGALAGGTTNISGFLNGADCLSTIDCMRALGAEIELSSDMTSVKVRGFGLNGLHAPEKPLYTGNSGTTTRMICGILSGMPFETHLTGDASIERRPMKRIIEPLSLMGADISSDRENGCAPLTVRPSALRGITYESPVASAQVKSAILLAGLYADGSTTVIEPAPSRNHTELMLKAFGADIRSEGLSASIYPGKPLHAADIIVPGDISSAAYFIVAALITDGSDILIKNVNINPTRAGIITVLTAMGGNITLLNERTVSEERVADISVRSSTLHGTEVSGDIIPALIDEIPVIAVAAAYADGHTVIKDAAELKVKESDRIAAITENLGRMGADITATADGMIINGGLPLHPASIETKKDHRIAMAFYTAALPLGQENELDEPSCVSISYPSFYEDMRALIV